jgi:hypothetical protein
VRQFDSSNDRRSVLADFLSAFCCLLHGAGPGPVSRKKEGSIDVRANPALNEALTACEVHGGATVGQSVDSVAWARDGGEPVRSSTTLEGKRQQPPVNQETQSGESPQLLPPPPQPLPPVGAKAPPLPPPLPPPPQPEEEAPLPLPQGPVAVLRQLCPSTRLRRFRRNLAWQPISHTYT